MPAPLSLQAPGLPPVVEGGHVDAQHPGGISGRDGEASSFLAGGATGEIMFIRTLNDWFFGSSQ